MPDAIRPIPVRLEVEDGFIGPPGAVEMGDVLGETAGVEDAEVRVDVRPLVIGRGFAAVVEAGPDEGTAEIRAFGIVLHPCLRSAGPAGKPRLALVCVAIAQGIILLIDPASGGMAAFLAADYRLPREALVEIVKAAAELEVVSALHVHHAGEALAPSAVHGEGRGPGRIEASGSVLEHRGDAGAGVAFLDRHFLISKAPDGHRWMIAVAADEAVEL